MGPIRRIRHTLLACVVVGAALAPVPAAATPLSTGSAHPLAAVDQNAVDRVKQELDAAESTAAQASRRALEASAVAERTRLQAETTAQRAAELEAQSAAADAAETSTTAAAGLSAARLYRTVGEGPLVAQVLTDADPDSLLERLGILDRVRVHCTLRPAGFGQAVKAFALAPRRSQQRGSFRDMRRIHGVSPFEIIVAPS